MNSKQEERNSATISATIDEMCNEITKAIGPIIEGKDSNISFHCFCLCLTSLGFILNLKKEQQKQIFDHYLETGHEAQKTFQKCEDCREK